MHSVDHRSDVLGCEAGPPRVAGHRVAASVSPGVTVSSSPQLEGSSEDLDLPGRSLDASSGDLSCDSRANSDYEDTDGVYTDGEGSGPQDADEEPRLPALARSSEPAWEGIAAEWDMRVGVAPRGGEVGPISPSAHVSRVTVLVFPPGRQPPPPGPGQHAVSTSQGQGRCARDSQWGHSAPCSRA